jgi:eukaryotic-like serine/threonine-protein kinase
MPEVPSLTAEKERQLNEVLAQYLEAVEAGGTPDRTALQAQHTDLAVELGEFFNNLDGLVRSGSATQISRKTHVSNNPALPPGSRFGDYEILKEIARGGMGIVYRARHLSLNREVALKMILGSQQSKEPSLRRFRIEAEAVAHLDHPNIVPIYEVGEIHGQPYFTMKFVEGGSLSEHLEEFQLPFPETEPHPGRAGVDQKCTRLANLMAAVARAVHHAHERGILHRDLKPANILLGGEGQPLVADFGLAKRVESPHRPDPVDDHRRHGQLHGPRTSPGKQETTDHDRRCLFSRRYPV